VEAGDEVRRARFVAAASLLLEHSRHCVSRRA
jgi:hypothetical protein